METVEHIIKCSTKEKCHFLEKSVICMVLLVSLAWSCAPASDYDGQLHELSVAAAYPEGFGKWCREGVEVTVEDALNGMSYTALTDASGVARISLVNGNYSVRISDIAADAEAGEEYVFNGSQEKVMLIGADRALRLSLTKSVPGKIVFREIYCGGCQMYPKEGTYFADKYVILHNNSSLTQYLDGLCFGTADPYNSNASNVWISRDPVTGQAVLPDFVPVIQAIWQFPGSGHDHPLKPGEDAVLVIGGAVDHTTEYPLSVNLNNAANFVCYSNLFPNTKYHPAPGDKIQQDHIMNLPIKMGQANAYTFSYSSPASVIFRAPEGTTIEEFLSDTKNIVQKPGFSDRIVKIPLDWVEDAAEVFTNNINGSTKRLNPQLDAGYVRLSESWQGRVLYRAVNDSETRKRGYEVLLDTNNSSADFCESERNGQALKKQTLKKK